MPGSVVDLSQPGASIPAVAIVDTNVIVEYLLATFLDPTAIPAAHVTQFFNDLFAINGRGIVTPTAFTEFVHVLVRARYRHEYGRMTPVDRNIKYASPVRGWRDLYKQDPTILQSFLSDLERFRRLLIANRLLLVSPDKLGPIASGRRHDEELVHLVGAYGLDSSDAAILMEAQQLGVTDVVSLDADMQRARADFTIYTWS
jgi:predicted nucleic acid-binding protein